MKEKINWKALIIALLIPVAIGALFGYFTQSGMETFAQLNKPPLTPPAIVFPIVWTMLYLLMGVSSYLIWTDKSVESRAALGLYSIQLLWNYLWTVFFFAAGWRLFAFYWLGILILLVILMIVKFHKISPAAAYLQIPYLVWLFFAAYLNLGVYFMNR